ncbi:MAG: 50S ribosomal protein L20 [Planctomycetes bacterium]|nr:50S ribosomal protein L20 [Planctomycetota bacterium]
MRIKTSVARHKRRRRLLDHASGFRGTPNNRLRRAKDSVQRSMNYMFDGRKLRKRDFRGMFIVRVNAAVRAHGITYSRFISGLAKAGVALDRKVLAELAIRDAAAFTRVVETAKAALS